MFEDDDEEGDDYGSSYSESGDMKSQSEFNDGIHMEADYGCKSHDDYGGRAQGGGRLSDYNTPSWLRKWDDDESDDTF